MTGMTKASVFPLPVTCKHHGDYKVVNDYVITDWGDDELSDGYEDSLQLGMS